MYSSFVTLRMAHFVALANQPECLFVFPVLTVVAPQLFERTDDVEISLELTLSQSP
jgi:hypothetical protein